MWRRRLCSQKKGKSALHLSNFGWIAGKKGRSALHLGSFGQTAKKKGKNASHLGNSGRIAKKKGNSALHLGDLGQTAKKKGKKPSTSTGSSRSISACTSATATVGWYYLYSYGSPPPINSPSCSAGVPATSIRWSIRMAREYPPINSHVEPVKTCFYSKALPQLHLLFSNPLIQFT